MLFCVDAGRKLINAGMYYAEDGESKRQFNARGAVGMQPPRGGYKPRHP